MIELELKAVVPDLAAARVRIERAGARLLFVGRLEDRRYDTRDRALTRRDEVFRLRVQHAASTDGAEQERDADRRAALEWKGPTQSASTYKVREELSAPIRDPDALAAILARLGYEVTFAVDREIWQYEIDAATIRFERYPLCDDLVEVEGTPEAIEAAIGHLGIPRDSFSNEALPAFAARFQQRTGRGAVLSYGTFAADRAAQREDD